MTMEKFHYQTASGKKLTLKRYADAPTGIIRKARKEGQLEVTFAILEWAADEKTLEVLDEMTQSELTTMTEKWVAADDGANLGES